MKRTSILLPERLKIRAEQHARSRGISFGELVRRCLRDEVDGKAGEVREDSLFRDSAVYGRSTPSDLAAHHDRYLYDEDE